MKCYILDCDAEGTIPIGGGFLFCLKCFLLSFGLGKRP